MDFNLGNGFIETYVGEIIVFNVRIRKEDTLKPAFDVLPFLVNIRNKEDYLKLLDYGLFNIELEEGKMLVDCKLNDIEFIDENMDVCGYYSHGKF